MICLDLLLFVTLFSFSIFFGFKKINTLFSFIPFFPDCSRDYKIHITPFTCLLFTTLHKMLKPYNHIVSFILPTFMLCLLYMFYQCTLKTLSNKVIIFAFKHHTCFKELKKRTIVYYGYPVVAYYNISVCFD